jgi:hypothetical protein
VKPPGDFLKSVIAKAVNPVTAIARINCTTRITAIQTAVGGICDLRFPSFGQDPVEPTILGMGTIKALCAARMQLRCKIRFDIDVLLIKKTHTSSCRHSSSVQGEARKKCFVANSERGHAHV